MRLAIVALLAAAALLPTASAQVSLALEKGKVAVQIDGKPFTDFYFMGPEVTKPYFHPLRAASGTYVTRMWPMQEVPGEPRDHQHQRGLWFAHANVNDLDFWNNEASYTTPRRGKITVAPEVPVKISTNTITATFNWTDLKGNKLLTEDRIMSFPYDARLRIVDFD